MAKCCQQINLFGLSVGTFNHLIAEGLEEGDIVAAYGRPGGESHGCAGRVLAAGTRHDENGMWHKYPPRQHQRYTGGRWVNVCRDTQLTMLGVFGNDANAIRVGARKEIDSIEDPKLKSAYEKSFRAGICASVRGSVESAYAAKNSARLRRRGLSAALLSWLEPESERESESESKLESEQGQESDQAVFPDLISFNGTRYSDDKRGDLVYRDGFGNQLDLTLLMMDSQ
ncbi:MAG: hypothetical protein M1825_004005 [Sarcosagium campestre]|nr:MAG: hypothetical protein M1825_004005 [Sarcosagium campestre]